MWRPMGGLSHLVLICCWTAAQAAWGGTVRASAGAERDSNPFDTASSRRPAWVSRVTVYSDSPLLERERVGLQLRHHCGIKRYWRSASSRGPLGDIVADQLELAGRWRVRPRWALDAQTELKVKNVQRVSGEDSYLRGGAGLGLSGQGPGGLGLRVEMRQTADDARDSAIVDLNQRELAAQVSWQRSRRLAVQSGVRWRHLRYGRPLLAMHPDSGVVAGRRDQRDGAREVSLGLQLYAALLAQAGYSFADNGSNSLGYAYRAHRVQLTVARHLLCGVDGHAWFTAQVRDYTDKLGAAADSLSGEQDEYEQALLALGVERQLSPRYSLSCQYRWARNGSTAVTGSYRKRVLSFSVDMAL